ncbi:MAG: translation initiation factor IF-2 [Devosia sp.]|uniref:translation initiation factor IF-2 n=1 Tax=Devosia sp. TaxID=1871048 RepID=UPI001A5DFDF2|nr:translation initiation factor IF-2 [Devosia sp.]MBL8598142.1 translation initiation factor IF-2 [Devosia sp.]
MADSDDKTQDGAHKKTLTLKGGASAGARPGMSRGPRTVVVEKRTRVVPHGTTGAPTRPTPAGAPAAGSARPQAPLNRSEGRGPSRPQTPSNVPRNPGLSSAEAEARARVLREAGARQAEDDRRAREAEARRAEEDARRREIREAAARADAERAAAAAAEAQAATIEAERPAPAPVAEERVERTERTERTDRFERSPSAPRPGGYADRRPGGPGADRRPGGPGADRRPGGPSTARPGGPATGDRRPGGFADRRPGGPSTGRPGGFSRPGGPAPVPNMPAPPSDADGRRTRTAAPTTGRPVETEEARRAAARVQPERPNRRGGEDAFARSRLTVASATTESDRDRGPSLAAMRRRRDKKMGRNVQSAPKLMREVIIPDAITVGELANRMAERSVTVIKMLMGMDRMATINDVLDADTAELIATELGHTVKRVSEADVEQGLYDIPADDKAEDLTHRAPVVTIMGHVDHGKTSLLDAIREANVVAGEAGGITQHIGAYQVEINGQKITFLDTPGHEAFTAMRARGAQATDIAVLVVAADDGVMPQTIESIKHAKAAGVPIIVAINKMDKPSANPTRVRTELLQHEVFVESMGGEVLDVEVSAVTRAGLDKLLETILLQAEVLELQVPRDGRAEGLVIEAKLDRGRGAVATVLVQRGTLRVGDIVVAGTEFARVRALIDDKGNQDREAGPSTPVEVLGFTGVPSAGDRFSVVETEARAREITEFRQRQLREKSSVGGATSLEQMMNQLKVAGISKFPLIIKGDVQGSVEAIVASLNKLSTDEVSAQILMSGVGAITESDVTLANASRAIIIGFNVRANKQANDLATRDGIEIRYYNIIYDLVDDVKQAMSGLLKPERRETFIGYAEILEVFQITKVGKVAGCRVTEGIVERGAGVRLLRDNVVIHEGKLKTLKRFKDEVKEVPMGQECGMAFESYEDIRAGDVIECFRVEQVTRSL